MVREKNVRKVGMNEYEWILLNVESRPGVIASIYIYYSLGRRFNFHPSFTLRRITIPAPAFDKGNKLGRFFFHLIPFILYLDPYFKPFNLHTGD